MRDNSSLQLLRPLRCVICVGGRLKQLLLIRTSQRYRGRLAASLQRAAGQEGKHLRAARDAELKRVEAQRQLIADSGA